MSIRSAASVLLCAWFTSAPASAAPRPPAGLADGMPWTDEQRVALEALLAEHGVGSPGHDAARPPVAVFDWDNTVIKNDIGDGTMVWMLNHDQVIAPRGGDWSSTSRYLSRAALAALAAACGEHPAGAPLPTSTDADCADEIFAIYEERTTAAGAPAWLESGYDHRRIAPSVAWAAQLQAGHTPAEVRALADEAIDAALAAPIGATGRVGSHDGVPAWIRIYAPIHDLIGALQGRGFDVWVVSASPEPVVQAFAGRVGVDADHVVGIRALTDADGRLTPRLAGCGPVADGEDGVMTYKEGKRCWIRRAIFGVSGRAAMTRAAEPAGRPVFVAGDADTDVDMLRDALALRLVIDRHKTEVMCHALSATHGSWLIAPMFIEPLPARAEPYPCATTGCRSRDGERVPCRDDAGAVIADQRDPAAAAP